MKLLPLLTALCALASVLMAGCATAERSDAQAWESTTGVPFEQRPALYAKLEADGKISATKRSEWDGWVKSRIQEEKERPARVAAARRAAEQREHDWAALTPAQRLEFEMRQKELEARQQQMELAAAYQAQQQELARRRALASAIGAMGDQIQAQQAQRNAQIDAQIRENAARVSQLPPQHRTYESTVTPADYPGGPRARTH